MHTDWLKLSEVAKKLGVHPSTIRNWVDKGKLPSHRTPGGHRRFLRKEFDLWEMSQRASISREEAAKVVQGALGYTRLQISQGRLEKEAWYRKLDKAAREEYGRGGRQLMQGLSRFLASENELGHAEARVMGYDYASLGRRHGLNSLEATRALLFFRNALQEALLASYEDAAIHSVAAWRVMARKMEAYTNEVLLSLLETYQALEGGRK
jgi:excisionase family DNA binding protein